ncbi:MAG: vWA domain-containing protein [Chloroflexota bacterium]
MYHRSPLVIVLLLALLLPLFAACGGSGSVSSGVNQPTGAVNREQEEAPAEESVSGSAGDDATGTSRHGAIDAPVEEEAPVEESMEAPPETSRNPSEEGSVAEDEHFAASEPAAEIRGPAPTPAPPEQIQPPEQTTQNEQQGTPLRAGEVDDNADFTAYQAYLSSFYSPPGRIIDVSERYLLTVTNDQQQPVLDARVRLFDGEEQVFEGRTYAGGSTVAFPKALGINDSSQTLRVLIEKGNAAVEGTLSRGQEETFSYMLEGAEARPEQPRLDVLFLLDATGSMGDEIAQIQQTIISIADRIDQFSPRPELRFGLVAYRDHGDDFVTRTYDFTSDVDAFEELLLSVSADGGGDEPEALNEGLHETMNKVTWSDDAVRLVFLVADAPPHEPNNYNYVDEVRAAVTQGIKIYPIAASNTDDHAEYVFRQLAQQTLATFIFLTYQPGQEAGTPGETTTHNVDPDAFTVERLDDLVVQVIQRELARAVGAT